jgi:uncharacterized protein
MAGCLRSIAYSSVVLWVLLTGATFSFAQVSPGNAAHAAGDYAKALEIFRQEAQAGSAVARYNLGIMYLDGLGVPPDPAEAANWFRSAADAGYTEAEVELGLLYAQGHGVSRDYEKATELWQKAANTGNARAAHLLAMQYSTEAGPGGGVARDNATAAAWLRRAAEAGYAESQFELGRMYFEGKGVERDAVVGMMWLLLARESYPHPARFDTEYFERAGRRLTDEERALARRKADACRQSNYQNCG